MTDEKPSQDKPQDKPQDKKIIVDDDWKAQAQAEKARLDAEQERTKAKPDAKPAASAAPAETDASGGEAAGRQLPPASFATHVTTLASQALFAMGAVADPQSRRRTVDLDLAKFHIDTLRILEEKTSGNLTDDEKSLLNSTLYELRSHYIQLAQQANLV